MYDTYPCILVELAFRRQKNARSLPVPRLRRSLPSPEGRSAAERAPWDARLLDAGFLRLRLRRNIRERRVEGLEAPDFGHELLRFVVELLRVERLRIRHPV